MATNAMAFPLTQGDAIPGTRLRVRVEVVFGKPSKKCLGTGICKVLPHEATENCGCASARAEIRKVNAQLILLRFRCSQLCPTIRKVQFAQDQFTVEESLELPAFVRSALVLEARFILRGCYPVHQNEHFVTIALNLL